MRLRFACVLIAFLSSALSLSAQTASAAPASSQVPPPLIQFSNVATDEGGNSMSGAVSITFSLYTAQQGGEPLWTETQKSVELDSTGHYSVQLGVTQHSGVPTTLFTTGEARWLGVRIAEQAEQPRLLLLSVPYALKAGDAATIGGLPPSAFALAAPAASSASTAIAADASPATNSAPLPAGGSVTGTGTLNFLPLWDSTSDIISSVLFQLGSGATAKIGINTTKPASTLDVKGASTIRGLLSLPATGVATATKGTNSQPVDLAASAFNSGTAAAVTQTFQWQAEPVNNNTSNASGSLNLLFGAGTSKPSETGLNIASNGQITFATGQTFPGTGTITGITTASGSGLTGGGTSGTLNLALTNTCSSGQVLSWNGTTWVCTGLSAGGTITGVTAGTDLLGGGTSGNVTLNLDTTKVPQLNAANTFTGNQTVNGNLSATGLVTGSAFNIGSNLFASGSYANSNVFVGFSGNTSTTGQGNTATGFQALSSNTTGLNNTASGYRALYSNTASFNTASGFEALYSNTTGYYNAASGSQALFLNTTGYANTASGAVSLSVNTTGYGNTGDGQAALTSNTTGNANTGTGDSALFNNTTGNYNTGSGSGALVSNTTGSFNTGVGLYSGGTGDGSFMSGQGNTFLGAYTVAGLGTFNNAAAVGAYAEVGASNSLVLGSIAGLNNCTALNSCASTNVGIGTTTPTNVFTIGQGAGHAIADGWDTYSSRRWKTNIQTLQGALAKVQRLRGVSYELKDSGKHEVGVIAEEVGAVVPEVVSYEDNGKDARGVDYSRLTALLIEATKEQQQELAKALRQIKQQQTLLRAQSVAMRNLKAEVRETRETLRKVKAQVAAAQPALVAAK